MKGLDHVHDTDGMCRIVQSRGKCNDRIGGRVERNLEWRRMVYGDHEKTAHRFGIHFQRSPFERGSYLYSGIIEGGSLGVFETHSAYVLNVWVRGCYELALQGSCGRECRGYCARNEANRYTKSFHRFFLNGYYLKAKVVLFCFFANGIRLENYTKKRGILTDTPRLKL